MRMRYRLFIHPIDTIRLLVYHYRSALYDWYLGIDACPEGVPFPPDGSPCSHYDPTKPKFLRWIFRNLPIDFREYSFIDFGSGKGRVLIVAGRHRFRQVIGIEYAKDLHEVAVKNIQSARRSKCSKIESICMDATEYAIPQTPCVLFFYNPFQGEIMEKVLANVRASLESSPRLLYIAYVNPVLHDQLIGKPGLQLMSASYWCNLYTWSVQPKSNFVA